MNEEPSGKEMNAEDGAEREAMDRRECLRAMGKWSAAAIGAAAGAVWLGSAGSAQAGAWVNRRIGGGGWVNRGGGGGWINRRVGGGGWINRY